MTVHSEKPVLHTCENRKVFRRHLELSSSWRSDIDSRSNDWDSLFRRVITEVTRFRSPHSIFSEKSNSKFPKMLCSGRWIAGRRM